MKVIVISGHARHGKDTAAKMLADKLKADGYTVLITHYADLLKYICKTFFGWDGNKDEAGRALLQKVGTDIIRKRYPDFFVGFLSVFLSCFSDEWDYAIIPDARFPNEVEKLKEKFDVTHLRMVREIFSNQLTLQQQAHSSETALDDTRADDFIHNDGGLDELNAKMIEWTERRLYERVL